MSGIYIPNMKMPTNCFACNFAVDGVCVAMKPPKTRHWRAEDVTNYCPLVEVPDHGRLIDADALLLKLLTAESGKVYDYCYPCKEVLRAIKDSPTIIESEE